MEKTKFIIYCRVSTKDQSISLEAQKRDCKKYIEDKGGEIIATFEEKESGKRNDRPELLKAIHQAKTENATILVAKLDRLTRSLSFWSIIEESKVNIEALNLPILNALTVGVFLGLAQMERELISSRTKRALAELKEKGVKLGKDNLTSEGRKRGGQTRHERAKESKENKQAYQLVKVLIGTTSKAEITRRLNEGNFLTPSGGKWSPVGVANLIKLYQE